MLKVYTAISGIVFAVLGYEYAVLNRVLKAPSLFYRLKKTVPVFQDLNLNPGAGYPISYWFGWIGFGLMMLLLVYSVRKRFHQFRGIGSLGRFLDFHIFCGLLGPIFIIYHTNFTAGGLVAVSFWSMIISAGSGIVGRYVYFKSLENSGALRRRQKFYDEGFAKLAESGATSPARIEEMKHQAVYTICGRYPDDLERPGFFEVVDSLALGSLRFTAQSRSLFPSTGRKLRSILKEYGRIHQRLLFLDSYKRFMGYWHAFHLPFAIFMYVIAVIHIVTALIFGVRT